MEEVLQGKRASKVPDLPDSFHLAHISKRVPGPAHHLPDVFCRKFKEAAVPKTFDELDHFLITMPVSPLVIRCLTLGIRRI